MKSKIVGLVLMVAIPVLAVDFEQNFVPGFSVPASMVEVAKKNDRNFAAAKTAIEATKTTADAAAARLTAGTTKASTNIAVTGFTVSSITNVFDDVTNVYSVLSAPVYTTNITKFVSGVATNAP